MSSAESENMPPPLPAAAPPQAAPSADEMALLLTFLGERDHPCPRCGYNLRNLTTTACPECHEPLRLTVGVQRLRYELLIAALAPGIFSGMAAFFCTSVLIIALIFEGPPPPGAIPWQPVVIVSFGWLSAVAAIVLFLRRQWFLKQSGGNQGSMTAGVWFVHVAFFIAMLVSVLP
jgi:hypothetical protein